MNIEKIEHTPPDRLLNIDIEYFKEKLKLETSPLAKMKIKKQIELLEDAVVVYHLRHPSQSENTCQKPNTI